MDIKDIRKLSDEKLSDQLEDLKEGLFNLRFQQAFGQLEDQNSINRSKRDVARVKTVIRERQLGAQKDGNNG
jgi:large subunit ribosomal protein L29